MLSVEIHITYNRLRVKDPFISHFDYLSSPSPPVNYNKLLGTNVKPLLIRFKINFYVVYIKGKKLKRKEEEINYIYES